MLLTGLADGWVEPWSRTPVGEGGVRTGRRAAVKWLPGHMTFLPPSLKHLFIISACIMRVLHCMIVNLLLKKRRGGG